jgi:branched-subunit amino acid aminotransferase/4-amino-4-deoxychorismate lyase
MPNGIIYNGSFFDKDNFGLDYQNRAFRYGDGFFETIRCVAGQPLWIDHHWNRFSQALQLLKMDPPEGLDKNHLIDLITELLSLNDSQAGARVRLSAFRGIGGFYKPITNETHFLIESQPLDSNRYFLNTSGKMVGIFDEAQKLSGIYSQVKSINAQLFVMASLFANENGWDDCIIINENGTVAEAISSNIFMVSGNKLYTPSLDQGCVDGVMKKVITSLAQNAGFTVNDCLLTPEDLLDADEVFLTNTVQGIQWVKGFGKKRYYHKISDILMDRLVQKVDELISV